MSLQQNIQLLRQEVSFQHSASKSYDKYINSSVSYQSTENHVEIVRTNRQKGVGINKSYGDPTQGVLTTTANFIGSWFSSKSRGDYCPLPDAEDLMECDR